MSKPKAEALADASAFLIDADAHRRRFIVPAAGLILLSIALSQPRWGVERRTLNRSADLLWLVIDVGQSMRCRDLPGSRGEFAKAVAGLVVEHWNGKVRVSTFDRNVRLLSPASSDSRRTHRTIERLHFDASTLSSLQAVADHIANQSLSEPFVGVVLSDGGGAENSFGRRLESTNGRWIVVGLGDAENPSPVPSPEGGWIVVNGVPTVSKRNEPAITNLSQHLSALQLTAWPDAEAVASKVIEETRSFIGASEAGDVVPRQQFQWFAAAALMLLLQPWRWRLDAGSMTILAVLLLTGSAFAADGTDAYPGARSELVAGRWAEARLKFERLTSDQRLLGWAHWGSGCVLASMAEESSDRTRRHELIATAIRSFREAARSLSDADEQRAVTTNIGIAKRMLVESASDSPSEAGAKNDVVKKNETKDAGSSSVGEANPNVDRKAGTEIGGGGVERPVAGLSIADPGPLSRNQAEAILASVVEKTEVAMPKRAGGRPKQ